MNWFSEYMSSGQKIVFICLADLKTFRIRASKQYKDLQKLCSVYAGCELDYIEITDSADYVRKVFNQETYESLESGKDWQIYFNLHSDDVVYRSMHHVTEID